VSTSELLWRDALTYWLATAAALVVVLVALRRQLDRWAERGPEHYDEDEP
jgi:hypothetical protein